MHPDPPLRMGPKIRMTGTKILGGDGVEASTSVSTVGFWKDGKEWEEHNWNSKGSRGDGGHITKSTTII